MKRERRRRPKTAVNASDLTIEMNLIDDSLVNDYGSFVYIMYTGLFHFQIVLDGSLVFSGPRFFL